MRGAPFKPVLTGSFEIFMLSVIAFDAVTQTHAGA